MRPTASRRMDARQRLAAILRDARILRQMLRSALLRMRAVFVTSAPSAAFPPAVHLRHDDGAARAVFGCEPEAALPHRIRPRRGLRQGTHPDPGRRAGAGTRRGVSGLRGRCVRGSARILGHGRTRSPETRKRHHDRACNRRPLHRTHPQHCLTAGSQARPSRPGGQPSVACFIVTALGSSVALIRCLCLQPPPCPILHFPIRSSGEASRRPR